MSALRQLLGALWAAVWLRGRLLGLRLRRLFSRRLPTDPGPDFHLAASETPVEGIDYELAALPAELASRLKATRAELLGSAREASQRQARPTRARRARSIAAAIAALLALGAVGAGASALVAGSTGVPAVDRLLGVYEQELVKPDQSGVAGPGTSNPRPRADSDSISLDAPLGDGSGIRSTFYVSADGSVCSAVTGSDADQLTGGVHCADRAVLEARLVQDQGILIAAQQYGGTVVLSGVVSDRVTSLEGLREPLRVNLGARWSASDIGVLRPFVAVGYTNSDETMVLADFVLEAQTADGRRTEIAP